MINKRYAKNIIVLILPILLVLIIIIFVIKPGIIGYGVYQQVKTTNYSVEDYQENIQELKTELLVSNTNLSSCIFFNNKFSIELEKCLDNFFICEKDKLNFTYSMNKYEETIKNLKEDLNEKNKEIDDLKVQSTLLVKNLANNLCCKEKVDNPNINFYILENNKIICLEEGTLKISCKYYD